MRARGVLLEMQDDGEEVDVLDQEYVRTPSLFAS